MFRIIKSLFILFIFTTLSACGGSDEEDNKEIYTISSDLKKLSFKNEFLHENDNQEQVINVKYNGEGISIGYATEDVIVGWLEFEHNKISEGESEITFKLNDAHLIEDGNYSTEVLISTGDFGALNLSNIKISVNLEIWKEEYSITSNVEEIKFKNEFLKEAEVKEFIFDVEFDGPNFDIGFSPDGTPAGWIDFSYEILQDGIATVKLAIKDEDKIINNFHNTKIRLLTGDFDHFNKQFLDIDVQLAVWRFETSKNSVGFDFIKGNNNEAELELTILGNITKWEIIDSPNWINGDLLSGEGESKVIFSVDATSFDEVGQTESFLLIRDNFSEKEISIPLSVGVKKSSFSLSQENVMLSVIGDEDITKSLLSISHNSNVDNNWQISSGNSWIEVEKIDDKTASITYKKSSLLDEGLHKGKVILSLDNNSQSISKEINVSLIIEPQKSNSVNLNGNPNTLNSAAEMISTGDIYMVVDSQMLAINLVSGDIVFQEELVGLEGIVTQLLFHPNQDSILVTSFIAETSEADAYNKYYNFILENNELLEIKNPTIEYQPNAYIMIEGNAFLLTEALEIANEHLERLHWDQANGLLLNYFKIASENNGYYLFNSGKNEIELRELSFNPYLNEKIKENITVVHSFEELKSYEVKGFDLSRKRDTLAVANVNHETFSLIDGTYASQGKLHNDEYSRTTQVYWHNEQLHILRYGNDYSYYLSVYDKEFNEVSTKVLEARSISKILKINGLNRKLYIDSNSNSIVVE